MDAWKEEVPPVRDPVKEPSSDDRLWALLAHLAPLVGLAIIGPLVIWLIKKDGSPFVDDQGKEALNFQISCLLATLASVATCILAPLAIVAAVGGIVYGVIAGIEANKGTWYRYPYTFRLIK